MAKSVLSLSVLCVFLAVGSAKASLSSAQYEGAIEVKSSQYDNASFDRHFNVSVELLPRSEMIGTATVAESRVCEGDIDEPSRECHAVCITSVTIDLGKALVQVRDLATGETVSDALPWRTYVANTVDKNRDKPCTPSSLEGSGVSSQVLHHFALKSVKQGKKTSLFVNVEPFAAGTEPSELATVSTLNKKSGDTYYVAPFSLNAQAMVRWNYKHAASNDFDGENVFGYGLLNLKN
jgi:hypothetical protein